MNRLLGSNSLDVHACRCDLNVILGFSGSTFSTMKKSRSTKQKKGSGGTPVSDRKFKGRSGVQIAGEIEQLDGVRKMKIHHIDVGLPADCAPREEPDVPPCDACGKIFAGKSTCKTCKSVFYCGRDCQVDHWHKGHKAQCASLHKNCIDTAKLVVKDIKDESLDSAKRYEGLATLCSMGHYKAAVVEGVHKAVQELFQHEERQLRNQWEKSEYSSFTVYVLSNFFCGGLQEGHANNEKVLSMNAQRIKDYVKSDPEALKDWWKASMTALSVFLDDSKDGTWYVLGQHMFKELILGLHLCFANNSASKVMMLPNLKVDGAASDRAQFLYDEVKQVMDLVWKLGDDSLEYQFCKLIEFVSFRCDQLKIRRFSGIGSTTILGIRDKKKKQRFHNAYIAAREFCLFQHNQPHEKEKAWQNILKGLTMDE